MSTQDELETLAAQQIALARRIEETKRKISLPVLPSLEIASPCPAEWSDMRGDERVRFCGQCEKNVYNLSDLTRTEAEALIFAKQGKLCVRYFQRKDGTVLTADCPVGVVRRRRRRYFAAAAGLVLAAGVSGHFKATRASSERALIAPPAHHSSVAPREEITTYPAMPTHHSVAPREEITTYPAVPPPSPTPVIPVRRPPRRTDIAGGLSAPQPLPPPPRELKGKVQLTTEDL